jgi:hypothetical protein
MGDGDFRRRFARDPEGMWLPECAVDTASLEALAAAGIRFTVLAQRQARRHRPVSPLETRWLPVDGGRIDPTRPYHVSLPSGRSIALFFYDQPISQAIAFEGLLHDGHHFAHRLMQGFSANRNWHQLLSIATDGESYGHHHRNGEMALAYALHLIERERMAELTNFGQFLARHPPTEEVQIWENSSWSCVHGVERWRSDCGCHSGMHPGWHQRWREPLRRALRLLADRAEVVWTTHAGRYLRDPEQALRTYCQTLIGRRGERVRDWAAANLLHPGDPREAVPAFRLMEAMRNAQLLFTSCAWFFDEVTGIETMQNLRYAARLIQLLRPYDGRLEAEFLKLLEKAPSNLAEMKHAAEAYRRYILPQVVDLARVIAHHCITHFDQLADGTHDLFCYTIVDTDSVLRTIGPTTVKLSRVHALSLVDGEELDAIAVVIHFGGHDFRCSIRGMQTGTSYDEIRQSLLGACEQQSITDLVRLADDHFGRNYMGLNHLFSEGRRELLQRITVRAFERHETALRNIFEENRKLMDYLRGVGAPLPDGFVAAADYVLKRRLLGHLDVFLETGESMPLLDVAAEMAKWRISANDPTLLRRFEQALEEIFHRLARVPDQRHCEAAHALLDTVARLDMRLNLWDAQNIVFALARGHALPSRLRRDAAALREPVPTAPGFARLALRLGISPVRPEEAWVAAAPVALPAPAVSP